MAHYSHRSNSDDYFEGPARSSFFVSRSPRNLPWDTSHCSSPMERTCALDYGRSASPRPCASFISGSDRFLYSPSDAPGVGSYDPEPGFMKNTLSRSASVTSSQRRQPFEDSRFLDWSPAHSPRCRSQQHSRSPPRRGGRGLPFFAFTSPRFPQPRNDVPGPGQYSPRRSDDIGPSWGAAERHPSAERSMMYESTQWGAYDLSSETGYPNHQSACSSFAPTSSRLTSPSRTKMSTPDRESCVPQARVRRSASFGSTSNRFKSAATSTPPPGSYDPRDTMAWNVALKSQLSTSAFSASSARELPYSKCAREIPGPGTHSPQKPRKPVRRSASFASGSPRLPGPKSTTPPPGAYDPDQRSSTTQKYSLWRSFVP